MMQGSLSLKVLPFGTNIPKFERGIDSMIHWPQSFGGKVKLCPRFYIDKGQFANKVYRIVTDSVVINRNSKFIQTHLTRVRAVLV
jgi:hypothetical protein